MPKLAKPAGSPNDNLTIQEAAQHLRVSHSTIRKLIKRQAIPFTTFGIKYVFKTSVLDAWMEKNTQQHRRVLTK